MTGVCVKLPCRSCRTVCRGGKSCRIRSIVAVLTAHLSCFTAGTHFSFSPEPSDTHITATQSHNNNTFTSRDSYHGPSCNNKHYSLSSHRVKAAVDKTWEQKLLKLSLHSPGTRSRKTQRNGKRCKTNLENTTLISE